MSFYGRIMNAFVIVCIRITSHISSLYCECVPVRGDASIFKPFKLICIYLFILYNKLLWWCVLCVFDAFTQLDMNRIKSRIASLKTALWSGSPQFFFSQRSPNPDKTTPTWHIKSINDYLNTKQTSWNDDRRWFTFTWNIIK